MWKRALIRDFGVVLNLRCIWELVTSSLPQSSDVLFALCLVFREVVKMKIHPSLRTKYYINLF
jgi:hypothetical protein